MREDEDERLKVSKGLDKVTSSQSVSLLNGDEDPAAVKATE